jgi:hypothetical protein
LELIDIGSDLNVLVVDNDLNVAAGAKILAAGILPANLVLLDIILSPFPLDVCFTTPVGYFS